MQSAVDRSRTIYIYEMHRQVHDWRRVHAYRQCGRSIVRRVSETILGYPSNTMKSNKQPLAHMCSRLPRRRGPPSAPVHA